MVCVCVCVFEEKAAMYMLGGEGQADWERYVPVCSLTCGSQTQWAQDSVNRLSVLFQPTTGSRLAVPTIPAEEYPKGEGCNDTHLYSCNLIVQG